MGKGGKQTQDQMLLCANAFFVAFVHMPFRKLTWDPAQWRYRAEEARTVADQMTHEEARKIIRRIALD